MPKYINLKRPRPVWPKMPIFTAKELKEILEYVQKDAKNNPCKRTKTTELSVLIMTLGLMPGELLRLNIEDLPCHHRESHIVVRNRWGVKTREVYLLDDSLETKIKEYVKKYRPDAKLKDALFKSRNRNRTSYQTLSCKFTGSTEKLTPYRRHHIGIAVKLGIKPFSLGMFMRTRQYQVAGERDDDTNQRKSKELQWVTHNRPEYISAIDAIKLAQTNNRRLSRGQLSKILKPDGPMRYMRKYKPNRCKVHSRDLMEYIKTLPFIRPTGDDIPDERVAKYLADSQAEQAKNREQKGPYAY